MIDTISANIKTNLPTLINPDRIEDLTNNRDTHWNCRTESTVLSKVREERTSHHICNRENGCRTTVTNDILTSVTASLPRLLGRPNGIQIKTDDELRAADAALRHTIQVLGSTIPSNVFELTRLDLVLNLPLDPRLVLALHRHARHPMIRRETQQWYNSTNLQKPRHPHPHVHHDLNTVRLQGTRTVIALYDKQREVASANRAEGPDQSVCVRVEIQLKGSKHIAKVLGLSGDRPIHLHELTIHRCYHAFRNIMVDFEEVAAAPSFKPNLASCLAVLEHHPDTWASLGGVQPLDWYRTGKGVSDKQFQEMRRQVRKQNLQINGFRWADHLPEDRLPDIIDVDEHGNATLVPSPCAFC